MTDKEKLLSLIGLSRRAGKVTIGQDNVFQELRKRKSLLILVTEDTSSSVLRKVHASDVNPVIIELKEISRYELGTSLGLNAAQIVSYDLEDGFAAKILKENDRGVADE